MDEQAAQQLVREWELGSLNSISSVNDGSVACWKLVTTSGAYFVKSGEDEEGLRRYSAVEQALNARGVRQALLHRSAAGAYLSSQGYAVYELLPGQPSKHPSPGEWRSFIAYLARYNAALGGLDLSEPDLAVHLLSPTRNPFAKADSVAYLLDNLAPRFAAVAQAQALGDSTVQVCMRALEFLRDVRSQLDTLPRQLIHGDLGPGNILYEDDRAVAVIDFTPYLESHLYALCVSLFWHCVYFSTRGPLDEDCIKEALSVYQEGYPLIAAERTLFHALMVKAAARMVFVMITFAEEGTGDFPPENISAMAQHLETVLGAGLALQALVQ